MGASGTAEPETLGDATTAHELDSLIDGIVAAVASDGRAAIKRLLIEARPVHEEPFY